MPSNPVLLASGELPLFGERLNVDAVASSLKTVEAMPLRVAEFGHGRGPKHRLWPASPVEGWDHAQLVIASGVRVDGRETLWIGHGLHFAQVRTAAEQYLAGHGMPIGGWRSPRRPRALHDIPTQLDDCPSDVLRLYLYVRSMGGNAVPPISDLPVLQGAVRSAVAA